MKVLVTDFDLTLYDDNYEKNLEYLKTLKDIEVIINTGREHITLFEDLKIECNYYILGDGSYIMNKNKEVIYTKPIKKGTIDILKKRIKQLKYTKSWFIDFDGEVVKLEVKIENKETAEKDLEYMIKDLDDVYGYVSRNWINIIDQHARKEIALEYLDSINHYDKIYTVGDGQTDYGMLKKYNGYLISKEKKEGFNCINNFLELKNKIK